MLVRPGETGLTLKPWLLSQVVSFWMSSSDGPYSLPNCAGVSHLW
jgi:hypothetical protein